jgi:hypothetical protein
MNDTVVEKLGHIILDVLELSDVEIEDTLQVLADTTSTLCATYDKTDAAGDISAIDLFLRFFQENIKYLKSKH